METRDIKLYGVAGKRIRQADITPTALKKQLFGSLVAFTELGSSSAVLGNNDQVNIEITVTHLFEFDMLIVEPYIALYVGTPSASTQLPGGSGVDESQWQVIGPFFDYQLWGGERHISNVTVYVRNISAGSQTVNFRFKGKFVARTEQT